LRERGYVEGQNITIEERWATALEDRDPTALLNSPPAIPTEVTMRPIGLVVVLTLSLTIPQSLLIRANEIIY